MKPSEAFLAWLDGETVQVKHNNEWLIVHRFEFNSYPIAVAYPKSGVHFNATYESTFRIAPKTLEATT